MSNNNYTSQGEITISYQYDKDNAVIDESSISYTHDVTHNGDKAERLEIGDAVAETMALTYALTVHCVCAMSTTEAAKGLLDTIYAQCANAIDEIGDKL